MKNDHLNTATSIDKPAACGGKISLQLALLALLCAGLLAGCEQIRKATYPSDFVYLEQKQIRGEMALLSLYLRQLDQILLDDSTVSSEQQERVLAILAKIESSTTTLGAGNIRTNHLVIDDHIDQFRNDVYAAINNASADPPNYFALGRLSGSCVSCHKFR
ncbi:MAG: hypothetical protein OEU50_15955 [Gammaproteobacteria bacterium]|nr:hypothetical protein [Gammaproteobacteria bacterium]